MSIETLLYSPLVEAALDELPLANRNILALLANDDDDGITDVDDLVEAYDERYRGKWDSVLDYATDLYDDIYGPLDSDTPYVTVDYHAFARDLIYGGDIYAFYFTVDDGVVPIYPGRDNADIDTYGPVYVIHDYV